VTIQDLRKELAEYYGIKNNEGVLVADVVPGDPADEAGIRPKDIIIEINGQSVKTSRDLTTRIANIGVGETVKIKVLRNRKKKIFNVKIGKRPDVLASTGDTKKQHENELGFRVSNITPQISQRFNIREDAGLIVVAVKPAGKAAEAGIIQGDIIIEINRNKIKSLENFKDTIEKTKKGDKITFLIQRMHAGLLVAHITR